MIFISFFILLVSYFSPSYGINEFTTNQEIYYQFDDTGMAQVEHKVDINNNFSQFYPKEYKLTLSGSNATNLQAVDEHGDIEISNTQSNNSTNLTLNITNPKTGKDQVTSFSIRYTSNNLANKKGKTWEISLPQFDDNQQNSNTSMYIKVPTSFGKLSSSPLGATISTDSQFSSIVFNKYNQKNKLVLTFGEYQLFNFDLKYHLKNNIDQNSILTIPIPPDTQNQKIYFTKIDPKPQRIETDVDGNWLAYFQLPPQSTLDVNVLGQAKIGHNQNYQFVSQEIFNSQVHWPVDNPQIKNLANTYTSPRQIYDYVVSNLNYDFNRVNSPNRRGAVQALSNPESSLCTDFTDLFVSIARAAKIGAREIEGYAYSNNTDVKPISVGTDILHAWPEYYDTKKQAWIPVDPTWGKTTGGINYFDDLDLNHFTLVIHNLSSDSPPPPGSYKINPNQKSVDITFAQTENIQETIKPIITTQFKPFSQSYIIIKNPNLFALDNFFTLNQPSQNILPLGEVSINFPKTSFISSLLPSNQNVTIEYSFNNQISQKVIVQNPYHFFNLFLVIIFGLIFLSFGAIILLRKK